MSIRHPSRTLCIDWAEENLDLIEQLQKAPDDGDQPQDDDEQPD
jgi:hypothetical protein